MNRNFVENSSEWQSLYEKTRRAEGNLRYLENCGFSTIRKPYDDYLPLQNMSQTELCQALLDLEELYVEGMQHLNGLECYREGFSTFTYEERAETDSRMQFIGFNHPIMEI